MKTTTDNLAFTVGENRDTTIDEMNEMGSHSSSLNRASETNVCLDIKRGTPGEPPQPEPQTTWQDSSTDIPERIHNQNCGNNSHQTSKSDPVKQSSPRGLTKVENQAATEEDRSTMVNVDDISNHEPNRQIYAAVVDLSMNSDCTRQRIESPLAVKCHLKNGHPTDSCGNTSGDIRCDKRYTHVSNNHRQTICTVDIHIDGMTCDSCSRGIEMTLSGKKGVKSITVSLAKKLATITYDKTLTAANDVSEWIEDMGFGATLSMNSSNEDAEAKGTNGNVCVFNITGMTCHSCARTIEAKLSSTDGIYEVSVSLEYSKATVHFDRRDMSPTKVVDAIEEMGFGACILAQANGVPDDTNHTGESGRREEYMVITPCEATQPGKELQYQYTNVCKLLRFEA